MPYKLLLIILLFVGFQGQAQKKSSMPKPLELAMKKGDYEIISSYFHTNVELSVLGIDNIYSEKQAKFIIKRFFENNKTKKFTIDHQGVKVNTTHYAGTLTTENGIFKVIILLNNNEQKTKIHQLRIENE